MRKDLPVATVNITAAGTGDAIQLGPIRMRVLEDGSRTDNRIGAVEIIVPPGVAGPPHTFANVSPGPVVLFNSFTPAYYVQYFRDLAHLAATDGLSPDLIARIMGPIMQPFRRDAAPDAGRALNEAGHQPHVKQTMKTCV